MKRFRAPLGEIQLTFSRSGGKGGQNVNKVATKVTLHWDVVNSTALGESEKRRLLASPILRNRLTNEGILVIYEQGERSQSRNRDQALARLEKLVGQALTPPKKRRKTAVPSRSREARLEGKSKRSTKKNQRRKVSEER